MRPLADNVQLGSLADTFTEPIALGVMAGLVLGKPLGIGLAFVLAVRTGLGQLPVGINWFHVAAIGALGDIGYTVSLLMVQLTDASIELQGVLAAAVLLASTVASIIGLGLIRVARTRSMPYRDEIGTRPEVDQ